MIGNRYRQRELILLVLCWALAISIQLLICNLISSIIWLYVFKQDFLSSYRIIEWIVSILRNRMFWGFCLGVFFAWRTLLLDGQIELETALCFTSVVGGLLGFLPLMVGNGQPNWVVPIFFMECAPLCALFWQLLHLGELRFVNWQLKRVEKAKKLEGDLKAVKAEDNLEAQVPDKVLVEETKEPKKEDKQVEKPPVPPKDTPAEPPQKSIWRID